MTEPDGIGDGELDLGALLQRVERRLLGGPRELTRLDVAARSGLSVEELTTLWRALGFAAVGDDRPEFTESDVDALRNVAALQTIGDIDEDLMRAMTRIIGQSFARLASWQGQLVVEIIGRRPELLGEGGPDQLVSLLDELTPVVAELNDYVWRRQLAAYFTRVAANAGASTGSPSNLGVGFVDMAGFTTLTRQSSEAELRDVITAFETLATDVVGGHDGQVVKTIGDEILYVADRPSDVAVIALELLERAEGDTMLPQLRAGVAYGAVVSRLGDVFGQTVNIASRLTSVARTDSVLVDDNLAGELRDDARFVLHPMRSTAVRGYRHLRPWRLRRAGE